ncbi:Phage-related lysozyme (muraminidase) [Gallibacterium anatis]|uniref:Lysozyme n=1 Tax=Gallibacterium anatis TaxID=750 RepID=A0A377H5V0_9PAST|nr:lysozyme [Gallibacterium anatis]KGQ55476.1 glycoside hydrolase [Gallibacterium anatis DSM 16844 = F 149]STO37839.1 Phage-related lysozyme (muraminidase) [Gallibacterium anatis]
MLKKAAGSVCSVAAVIAILLLNSGDELRTSAAGLELIGNAEGCRTQPYYCSANVLTVGIGSSELSGQAIEQRQYSLQEIANRWKQDIKQAETCVNRYANGKKMPQGAFDALVSITFNVGCSAMRKSTLYEMANSGYTPKMCDQFLRWVYVGGKKSNGLMQRRDRERKLCLSGY